MNLPAFKQSLEALMRRELDGFQKIVALDRLSGGASQETYRLEVSCDKGPRKYAIRRAPDANIGDSGGIGLALEARLFALAKDAGVPGPEIIHLFQEKDNLGEGFLMEWIEGETLGIKIVRDDKFTDIRPKLAFQCGEIIGRIHQIDVTSTGLSTQLKTLSTDAFIHQIWDQYEILGTLQPMIDYTARWLLENQPPETRETLVHNDFRNGNLMVRPDEGVTAVLDWEVAHIGNPVRDLGWICTNSWRFGCQELPVGGFGQRADLLAGYKHITGVDVSLEELEYWEVFGSFWWAVGCLRMADRYDQDPSVGVEYPAIGRRSSECQMDCVNYLMPGPVKVPEQTPNVSANMPDLTDLVESVRDFLRQDVAKAVKGRVGFLSRVGANTIDIALRELAYRDWQTKMDKASLQMLFNREVDPEQLKRELAEGLREGRISLQLEGLSDYLRQQVFSQLAIDQPTYSGFKLASRLAT